MNTRSIFCVECDRVVHARLTSGSEVYPHRRDLSSLPFWKCDACANFVGCHHKTSAPTEPLGVIATKQLKQLRMNIHAKLDPLWRNGHMTRRAVYRELSRVLGVADYHTASIANVDDARTVIDRLDELHEEFKL